MYSCHSCGNTIQAGARFCSHCGAALSITIPTGSLPPQSLLRQGHYQILERAGIGGMGAVYKALDLRLSNRTVALKEMSQDGLSSQDLQNAINAFTREAEMLANLKHQNLPHIYDQFEEGGRRYLVMEFIEGETLEQRLAALRQRGDTLPLEQALAVGKQLCSVLEYLHTRQPPIIFRDLKPANIMLDAQEQVYLIDFGIARLLKPGQARDTVALGSPGYAPPEQYRRVSSPRSDIYSLGATLHQMITGIDPAQNPFYFQPFSINLPLLERLVMRMVALDEQRRPSSSREVRRVLDRLARTRQPGQPAKKSVGLAISSRSSQAPRVCVLVSSDPFDQRLWISICDQLNALIASFPTIQIGALSLPAKKQLNLEHSIDEADLILLLLSEELLRSPDCMKAVTRALDRYDMHDVQVLAVLLSSCSWQRNRLAGLRSVPEEPITHPSIYAQEKGIFAVAKTIRQYLVPLVLQGKTVGPMNLQQWLLWQLYGHGRTTCPYFIVGHYVLKRMRAAGHTDILVHLFDLQTNQMVAEYLIGSLYSGPLASLFKIVAPSCADLQMVRGVASRQSPLKGAAGGHK